MVATTTSSSSPSSGAVATAAGLICTAATTATTTSGFGAVTLEARRAGRKIMPAAGRADPVAWAAALRLEAAAAIATAALLLVAAATVAAAATGLDAAHSPVAAAGVVVVAASPVVAPSRGVKPRLRALVACRARREVVSAACGAIPVARATVLHREYGRDVDSQNETAGEAGTGKGNLDCFDRAVSAEIKRPDGDR
jgi:hypothetical protein